MQHLPSRPSLMLLAAIIVLVAFPLTAQEAAAPPSGQPQGSRFEGSLDDGTLYQESDGEGEATEPESGEVVTFPFVEPEESMSLEVVGDVLRNRFGTWATYRITNSGTADFRGNLLIGKLAWGNDRYGRSSAVENHAVFVPKGTDLLIESLTAAGSEDRWSRGNLTAVLVRPYAEGESELEMGRRASYERFHYSGVIVDEVTLRSENSSRKDDRLVIYDGLKSRPFHGGNDAYLLSLEGGRVGVWNTDPAFLAGFRIISILSDTLELPAWAVDHLSAVLRAGGAIECGLGSPAASALMKANLNVDDVHTLVREDLAAAARELRKPSFSGEEVPNWFDWEVPVRRRAYVSHMFPLVFYTVGYGMLGVVAGDVKEVGLYATRLELPAITDFQDHVLSPTFTSGLEYSAELTLNAPLIAGLSALITIVILVIAYRAKQRAPAALLGMTLAASVLLMTPVLVITTLRQTAAPDHRLASVRFIDDGGRVCMVSEMLASVTGREGRLSIPSSQPYVADVYHRPGIAPRYLNADGSAKSLPRARDGQECATFAFVSAPSEAEAPVPLPQVTRGKEPTLQWEEGMLAAILVTRNVTGLYSSQPVYMAASGSAGQTIALEMVEPSLGNDPLKVLDETTLRLIDGFSGLRFRSHGFSNDALRSRAMTHDVLMVVRRVSARTSPLLPAGEVSDGHLIDVFLLPQTRGGQ